MALLSGIARPNGGNRRIFVGLVEDGEVTSFSSSPELFASPIHHGAAVLRGTVLYVMGGEDDTTPPTADVWKSTMTATTFTSPVRAESLPSPMSRMAMAESAGGVYLVGGDDETGTRLATVLRATFQQDGSLSSFAPQIALPSPRRHAAAVVHGDHLLVVGGQGVSDLSNVLTCPIDGSGALGACSETAPLPEPRSRHRAIAHEGRVYVVGGRGETDGRTVFVGELAEGGGVTAWRATSALPEPAVFTAIVMP